MRVVEYPKDKSSVIALERCLVRLIIIGDPRWRKTVDGSSSLVSLVVPPNAIRAGLQKGLSLFSQLLINLNKLNVLN